MKKCIGTSVAIGFILAIAAAAFGQNVRYDGVIQSRSGQPAAGAFVAVCSQPASTGTAPCTPLLPLCSSLTDTVCSQPNPVQADGLGNYHFYIPSADLPVTLQFYGSSVTTSVLPDQSFGGGSGGGTGTITGVTPSSGGGLTGGGTSGNVGIGIMPCASNQTLEYSGGAWTCVTITGTGTITGVTPSAGGGLTGGGTSGNVPVAIMACSNNQTLLYVGGVWICSTPGTGTITGVSTGLGSGLQGGGTTGNVNISLVTNCTSGNVLQWGGSSWSCENVGTLTGLFLNPPTGSGLSLANGGSPGQLLIGLAPCSAGQVYEYQVSTGWICTTPANTTPSNKSGYSFTGGGDGGGGINFGQNWSATVTNLDAAAGGFGAVTGDPFGVDNLLGAFSGSNIWNDGLGPLGQNVTETSTLTIGCSSFFLGGPCRIGEKIHLGPAHYIIQQGQSVIIENATESDIDGDGAILDWSNSAPNAGTISISNGGTVATVSGGTIPSTFTFTGMQIIVGSTVVGSIASNTTTTFTLNAAYTGTNITSQPYNIIAAAGTHQIYVLGSPRTRIHDLTVIGDAIIAGGSSNGHSCVVSYASDNAVFEDDIFDQCGNQGLSVTNSNTTTIHNVVTERVNGSGLVVGATIPPVPSQTVTFDGTSTATIGLLSAYQNLIYPGMKITVTGFTSTHAVLNCNGCLVTGVNSTSIVYGTPTGGSAFGPVTDTSGTITVAPFINNVIDGIYAYDVNTSPGTHTGNYALNFISSGYFGGLKGVTLKNWHVDNNIACLANGTTCTGDGVTHVCNSNAPDSQAYGLSSTGGCSTGGIQFTNGVTDYDIGAGSCRNTQAECTSEGSQRWSMHDVDCFRGHVDQFGTVLDNGSGCGTWFGSAPGLMQGISFHDNRFASNGYGFVIQNGTNATDDNFFNNGQIHHNVSYIDNIPNQLSVNGAMTSGSAVLSISPDANFPSGIIGATLTVAGAGPGGGLLTATVVSRSSSSSVTLSATNSSGSNVTGAQVIRTQQISQDGIAFKNNSPNPCNGFEGTVSISGTTVTGIGTTFNAVTDVGVDFKVGSTDYGNVVSVSSPTSLVVTTAAGTQTNVAYTLGRQCKLTINNVVLDANDFTNTRFPFLNTLTELTQPAGVSAVGPYGFLGTPAGNAFATLPFQSIGGVDTFTGPLTKQLLNSSTGTTQYKLVKISSSGAVTAATTDTSGIVGICYLNCGGSATQVTAAVGYGGIIPCVFDGTPTATHWVQISSSVAGDCTDAGTSRPTAGQILGHVVSQVSGTTWYVDFENEDVGVSASNPGFSGGRVFTTTATVLSSDRGGVLGGSCGSACTLNLPDPTNTNFGNNFGVTVEGLANSIITVTPTSPGTATFGSNATSTYQVGYGQTCFFGSIDNANWGVVQCSPGLNGALTVPTDTGSANAYIVNYPGVTSLTVGSFIFFKAANANTTSSTINVSGLGSKALTKMGNTPLIANDILASPAIYEAFYDGTRWQLLNPTFTGSGPLFNTGGGTAQAQTVSVAMGAQSLFSGLLVEWLPSNANTAAGPTLAVNGLTPTTITKCGTVALVAGDISTTAVAYAIYDGTQFELLNPQAIGCGNVTNLQPVTDSTTAVRAFNAAGTAIGTFDTTNGRLRIGDATAPNTTLDLVGKFQVNLNGAVTKIANVSTSGNLGVPGIFGAVDSTGNTADLAATNLIASVSVTGFFQVSLYDGITTVGSTSTLPTVCVKFTDGTSSVAQSVNVIPSNTNNSTTTSTGGASIGIYAKSGNAISVATGANCTSGTTYASTGTSMQYEVHARVTAY